MNIAELEVFIFGTEKPKGLQRTVRSREVLVALPHKHGGYRRITKLDWDTTMDALVLEVEEAE